MTPGLLSVILFVATAIGVVAAPLIVYATAAGFAKNADKFALTVTMLRICFPYIFFISLVSFAAGMLRSCRRGVAGVPPSGRLNTTRSATRANSP